MSKIESTTSTTTGDVRRDIRGVPLQHTIHDGQADPFIGACPGWCEGGCGTHWEQMDDRSHFGEGVDIALELESEEFDGEARTFYTATIRTYLQKHYREAEARIFLGRGEAGGVQMTLTEAALLRDRLTELIILSQVSS